MAKSKYRPKTVTQRLARLKALAQGEECAELEAALRTLLDADNPAGVVVQAGSIAIKMVRELLRRTGRQFPGDDGNLKALTYFAEDQGVLPRKIANYLHSSRLSHNVADHVVHDVDHEDAELVLFLLIKVYRWFSEEYPRKPDPVQACAAGWRQAKRRIERDYPQEAQVLDLSDDMPRVELDEADLEPSRYFTGRQELRDEIAARLRPGGGVFVGIHGMSGQGKSELAKQVALQLQREGAFTNGCLWIKLEGAFKEQVWTVIAEKLGFVNLSLIVDRDQRLKLLRHLLKPLNLLVILDNADDEGSLREAYFALKGKTVLITSIRRCPSAIPEQLIDLDDLIPEESANLYWRIANTDPWATLALDDPAFPTVQKIIQRISGHPLFISMVASQAQNYGWSPSQALQLVQERGIKIVVVPDQDEPYKPKRHQGAEDLFQFTLEQAHSGLHYLGDRVKAIFVTCAAVCGEFFYAHEIRPVLERYVEMYFREWQHVDDERAMQRSETGSCPICRRGPSAGRCRECGKKI